MDQDYPAVEFDLPEGFVMPEGAEPGKSFELVGEFRIKPDGKACLLSMGGVPIKSSSPAPESKETAGERAMAAFKQMKAPAPEAAPPPY